MEYDISAGEHERLIQVLDEEIRRTKVSLERIEDQAAWSDNDVDTSDLGDDYDNKHELLVDLEELRDKVEAHATLDGPAALDVDDWQRSALDQAREIAREQHPNEIGAARDLSAAVRAYEAGVDDRSFIEEARRRGHEGTIERLDAQDVSRLQGISYRAILADDLHTLDPSDVTDVYRIAARWDDSNPRVSDAVAGFNETVARPDRAYTLPATSDVRAHVERQPGVARTSTSGVPIVRSVQPDRGRADLGSGMRGGERYGSARHDAPQAGTRSRGIER